ncbi:isochorismatase family protein [Pontiella sp. NLcol2]|uniref:Isochorismatase family protein n=2 Tax=Pontiella agarivorans TaxID=3038953 RepID=A0ABU5MW15_9BACT|nr:isochorismatase family protein [Pontiella agarivorans]
MLDSNNAVLIVIDVQGRLHEFMADKDVLDANLEKLIGAAKLLNIPMIGIGQIPEKPGETSEPFRSMPEHVPMVGKTTFSCCGDPGFDAVFQGRGKKQVILAGIEAPHICVYETAVELLDRGVEVFVAADAVSSRTAYKIELALEAIRQVGGVILPTESILMALQKDAASPTFRGVLRLIK